MKNLIKNASEYIEWKTSALKGRDGKYRRRQEIRMTGKVARVFTKQRQWFVKRIENMSIFQNKSGVRLIDQKFYLDEIDDVLDDMPFNENMVTEISITASTTYQKGAKRAYTDLLMSESGVSFDLVNNRAVDYIEKLRTVQLSNYRGAIQFETKKRIRQILVEAAENGNSYSETATKIQAQGKAGVFSKARAELIATNQIGHAYSAGNDDMVKEYIKETSAIMQKEWITVGDTSVTPECNANEAEGWIQYDANFSSGDQFTPRQDNPRCRCTTGYRRVDSQGNEL